VNELGQSIGDEVPGWAPRRRPPRVARSEAGRRRPPLFFAIVETATGLPVGVASYLCIDTANGTIEASHLQCSPLLQRTVAATEAMYLMMRQAFELGYRRYEWKCDALNAASRRAAMRLGFTFAVKRGGCGAWAVRRGRLVAIGRAAESITDCSI
jgi:RimJ/RimL family protein N-acetyltransferase